MYWGDIGKGLFDTLLVGCLLGITGFFALASGIVALFASGAVKTIAAWIFGINIAIFAPSFLIVYAENLGSGYSIRNLHDNLFNNSLVDAVSERNVKKIKKLIKKGADVNKAEMFRTPLFVACQNASSPSVDDEIVEILLDAGADPNYVSEISHDFLGIWFKHLSPLILAIGNKREKTVQLLIEHGAVIDSYTQENVPFQFALFSRSYDCAKIILDKGAKVGKLMYDWDGKCKKDKTLIMELFDSDETEENIEAKAYILQKLLADYDVNSTDEDGRTALHYAARQKKWNEQKIRLVKMLLDAGANINAKDKDGKTPLICATEMTTLWSENLFAIEFFTSNGADKSLRDNDGKTALDLFCQRYTDIADYGKMAKENYAKIVEILSVRNERSQKTQKTEEAPIEKKSEHIEIADIIDNW